MSYKLPSLTCYAVLSAIELDLRSHIEEAASDDAASYFFGVDTAARANARRMRERSDVPETESVHALVNYLDFADEWQTIGRKRDRFDPRLASWVDRSAMLVGPRNRVAHSRPLEIDDFSQVMDFSERLVSEMPDLWPRLSSARSEIRSDPTSVLGLDVDLVVDQSARLMHNLPAPDFDETGFFGRQRQRRDIAKRLKGPWPVLSILGDGGVGKTALALQVAYDLLDDPQCPFEAIVWVTAKHDALTLSEIVRIEGAIQDSLGIFASASEFLGGDGAKPGVMVEVLEYLENFKVLLILDNLETVVDDDIRQFLLDLPNGSKVLITSRIGVGTENPMKLPPLSEGEAAHMIRELGHRRGIELLRAMGDDEMKQLASRLQCHPAFIKWFVSGVQAGQPVNSLLADSGLVLEFCMSNVYKYLGDEARLVLNSMMVLSGIHTLSELAYLNDLSAAGIQRVALELTTTNFVSQVSGGPAGTGYAISDFASAYLSREQPVPAEEREWLLQRHEDLYAAGGDIQASHTQNPFDPTTIDTRSAGDYHAARCLRNALQLDRDGNVEGALSMCDEAALLAPDFHEVWRIRAYVYELNGRLPEAAQAYEKACEFAPESLYAEYFQGAFLVSSMYGPKQGLQKLQRAAKREERPDARLMLAISAAHFALQDFEAAIEAACAAVDGSIGRRLTGLDAARAAITSGVHLVSRFEKSGDFERLSEAFERLIEMVSERVDYLSDSDVRDRLVWLVLLVEGVIPGVASEYVAGALQRLSESAWVTMSTVSPSIRERTIGSVAKVFPDRGFAFVEYGGEKFFLHASDLRQRTQFDALSRRQVVAFDVLDGQGGANRRAIRANWLR